VGFRDKAYIEKAMNTLCGLIEGIISDGVINLKEYEALKNWCNQYEAISAYPPFDELLRLMQLGVREGPLSQETRDSLDWFCKKFLAKNKKTSLMTADRQFATGMMGGVISDDIINKEELKVLKEWLEDHKELRESWPDGDKAFKRIDVVLADEEIDEEEHRQLLEFFEYVSWLRSSLSEPVKPPICATDPVITFAGKEFCFTGISDTSSREKQEDIVISFGGKVTKHALHKKTDYLVINNNHAADWKFMAYGTKIEEALDKQKAGGSIQILCEDDFWDAVRQQDPKVEYLEEARVVEADREKARTEAALTAVLKEIKEWQ
jgi:hypothetical protein